MKTAIVIFNDIVQIMLTPENKAEEAILKFIEPDKQIIVDSKRGSFFTDPLHNASSMERIGAEVNMCRGGYLRTFENKDSVILVIASPKPASEPQKENDQEFHPISFSVIRLNKAEIQSNLNRVKFAEGLIRQLPSNHEGRNTWLLNYGTSDEAIMKRSEKGLFLNWDEETQSCETKTS